MNLFKKILIVTFILTLNFQTVIAKSHFDNQEIAWKKAGSMKYYNDYITNYPNGEHIKKAIKKQEKIDYRQSSDLNIPSFYNLKYPNGQYSNKITSVSEQNLIKGNFFKIEFSKDSTKFFYKNVSSRNIAEKTNRMLLENGFNIENGPLANALYSHTERLLGGSLIIPIFFAVSVKDYDKNIVVLDIKNGTSFYSGGIVGSNVAKSKYRLFFNEIYQANL